MKEIRTLTTLTKKRGEIERSILAYERKLAEARTDLAHIKATMAIFAGGGEPGMHRVYVDLLRVFEYREISTLCVKALADGEQTTRELAERLFIVAVIDGVGACHRAAHGVGQQFELVFHSIFEAPCGGFEAVRFSPGGAIAFHAAILRPRRRCSIRNGPKTSKRERSRGEKNQNAV